MYGTYIEYDADLFGAMHVYLPGAAPDDAATTASPATAATSGNRGRRPSKDTGRGAAHGVT